MEPTVKAKTVTQYLVKRSHQKKLKYLWKNLSVWQTELASKSIIQYIVAMNTTTDKIKEKKQFQTINGIHIFSPKKYISVKKNLKWYFPHRPHNHHNFAFLIYPQYPAFCTSYNISQLIKNTK